MSKNYKKICTTLNFIKHLLILASVLTGCISVFTFASLVGIPIGITSSTVKLKICAIASGIKKYTPMVKKKKKKHDKIELLVKTKLNTIEVLISRTLIDSYISHDEFVSVNNVSKEYNDMEQEIKNLNDR